MADTPRVTVPVEPPAHLSAEAAYGWSCGYDAALSAAPAPEGGAVELSNEQIQSVMLEAIKEVRATVTDHVEAASLDADIARMKRGPVDMGATGWEVMRAVHRRLAALATREEAPAEAGEQSGGQIAFDAWNGRDGDPYWFLESDAWRQRWERVAAALRTQPPAREDAQPVAWLRPDTLERLAHADESVVGIQSLVAAYETKYNTVAVYTHPAPDALRVAVATLKKIDENKSISPVWIQRLVAKTLAALQAEQGAK